MSSPIRVGFVGLSATGWAASALGPSLLQPSLKNTYQLVAVSTTSESSSKASAEKYALQAGHSVKAYHGSTSQIASDPEIDLVAVSVKAPLHKAAVLPVIEAGKSFFVEWPAGRNTEDTLEMAEAARKRGVKSFVGLQGRNSLIIQKVKEFVESGAIGAIRSTTFIAHAARGIRYWPPEVNVSNAYSADRKNGATLLYVAAGHQLDSLTTVLGDFASIGATASTQYPTATLVDNEGNLTGSTIPSTSPDQYSISGILKSGAIATIVWHSGYKTTKGRRQLLWEINGEEGSIRLESDIPFMNTVNPTVYLNGEKVEVEGSETGLFGILGNAWVEYAKSDNGKYATIDDAVKLRRLLDAIEKSVEEGGRSIAV